MLTDRYTRTILTVIAACLVVIAVHDLGAVAPARAQSEQTHVVVDSISRTALSAFNGSALPVDDGRAEN